MCAYKHKYTLTPNPGTYNKTKLLLPLGERKMYACHKIILLKNNIEIYKQTLQL